MEKNQRLWRRIAGIALFFCLFLTSVTGAGAAEADKVRVGFFNFDGYHMVDVYGNRSGYGYEYLQYMKKYASFSYEYIGYEKSWSEMQDMLARGKIDILTSAHKTEEREKQFDFSDQPIGVSAAILTVKAGDDRYMTGNYEELDGIRVGMLRENSQNDSFERFSKENGFTYQSVYFDNNEALADALQGGGGIDAAVTSNLRRIRNEWIVASFEPNPFYVMVRKGNRKLLDEINSAIDQIETHHPGLQLKLRDKYYSADSGDEVAYTAEERDYTRKLRENGDSFQVLVNPDRSPLSYFKGDKAQGIIPVIAERIFQRAGIPYEIVGVKSRQDYQKKVGEAGTIIRLDAGYDFNEAERKGYKLTEPYMRSTVSCLTLREFSGKPRLVAALRNSDITEAYVQKMFQSSDIIYYDSVRECVDAVLSGRQDATYFHTYAIQQIVFDDVQNRLKETLVPEAEIEFSIAVRQTENPLLFSILNKAVLSYNQEELNAIVQQETVPAVRPFSILGYFYTNPIALLVVVMAAALCVFCLMLYAFRRKSRRLERGRVREFERFITYVCRANDYVMEVDLENGTSFSYRIKEGTVIRKEGSPYTEESLKERLLPEDMSGLASTLSRERIGEMIDRQEEVYFECRSKLGSDEYHWFSCTLQGMQRDREHPRSFMAFLKNIDKTKREEAEKKEALEDALASAQRAGEAKGAFMSRMSHEIRTPLNAIIGYLSIAQNSLGDLKKAGECLEKSEFAAHHLLGVINDVLDISAIESGRMKIASEPLNLKLILSGISSIFYTQAREKGVKFDIKLRNLVEERLVGDQLRLNQILMNLLSNAVKFTPKGGSVTLEIVQKTVSAPRVHLQIVVSDTGIGMSEEYKKKLFTPFEQQDASTARKFGGTGLGLSITKNLITMMDGTIEVESREGEGTRFTVGLSFETDRPVEEKKSPYDFSGVQILVVYDKGSDYESVLTILSRFGVKKEIAFEIGEALEWLEEKSRKGSRYDLCLLDWNVISNRGADGLRQIKEACAGGKTAVIAAVFDYTEMGEDKGEEVVDQIVLKPLFQSSVFDLLVNYCREQPVPDKGKTGALAEGLRGIRVLLAEDNEMNMEIATEILRGLGFSVDGAPDGGKAVEWFTQSAPGTYQAVLMDIQMPVMDGYEAARKIRASRHPQAQAVPIIALTADAFVEDVNRALAAGMNDHVAKPIDFEVLCRVLCKYVGV